LRNCLLDRVRNILLLKVHVVHHGDLLIGNPDIQVLILSEQLHSITAHFDTLRAVRFQDAIDKRIPKRRQGLKLLPPPEPVTTSQADNITYSRDWLTQQDSQPEVLESQQELMDEETQALQVELTNMMDAVQETERRMLEMSALNHLFSTHVLHQAQQIELLYLQASSVSLSLSLPMISES
jgi:syntaxin 18